MSRCYGCRGIGKYTSEPTGIPIVGGLMRVGAGWIEVRRNINPLLEKYKSRFSLLILVTSIWSRRGILGK